MWASHFGSAFDPGGPRGGPVRVGAAEPSAFENGLRPPPKRLPPNFEGDMDELSNKLPPPFPSRIDGLPTPCKLPPPKMFLLPAKLSEKFRGAVAMLASGYNDEEVDVDWLCPELKRSLSALVNWIRGGEDGDGTASDGGTG